MLCRAVWGSLRGGLRAVAGRRTPLPAAALQARHMSFGIPTSGPNLAFMVLGGGSLTAALVYAYKTVHSDSVRYSSRITSIETRLRSQEEVPADDPASIAEVMTLHAVAEEAVAVKTATEVASEGPDPGPVVMATVAVAEEPVAEAVVNIATEPPPEAEKAAEDVVTMVMEAAVAATPALPVTVETAVPVAEATVVPALEVLDAVKVLSGSVAEMAAASVGDESSSAALVPPGGRAEERRVVLAEEVKLEQASEDVASTESPSCHPSPHSHADYAEPEASRALPAGLEDTSHAGHVEPEASIMPPAGLEVILHVEHTEPEASTAPPTGLKSVLVAEYAEPETSTTPPAGLEDTTAEEDIVAGSAAAVESVEETGAEEVDEKTVTTTRAM